VHRHFTPSFSPISVIKLSLDAAAANIFDRYLPYVSTAGHAVFTSAHTFGLMKGACDVWGNSTRKLMRQKSTSQFVTIGTCHAALLTTCQQRSKQLQKQWARCFELACMLLDAMPSNSGPQSPLVLKLMRQLTDNKLHTLVLTHNCHIQAHALPMHIPP